jgi:hypothetical protein
MTTLTLPALSLVEPHARLIWLGKKKLIVKSKPYTKYIGKTVFLVNSHIYGIIRLDPPKPMDGEKCRKELRHLHKITDEEWRKWWGKPKKVYIYTFYLVRKYKPPLPFEKPKGTQVWIRKLTVKLPD